MTTGNARPHTRELSKDAYGITLVHLRRLTLDFTIASLNIDTTAYDSFSTSIVETIKSSMDSSNFTGAVGRLRTSVLVRWLRKRGAPMAHK